MEPNDAPVPIAPEGAASSALREFFRIAKAWGLSDAEQADLLGVRATTLARLRVGEVNGGAEEVTAERLSDISGIHAALQILFPTPERAAAWLRRPNAAPLFDGGTALDRMRDGQMSDLAAVRQYLEAQVYC